MENKLLQFIDKYIDSSEKVNLDDDFGDIGIDGLDAEVFFDSFSKEFSIDMSNFDFFRYFSGENPYRNFFRDIIKYWGKTRSFKVSHLIYVVELKKWVDPK